jgi:hypothetical protein
LECRSPSWSHSYCHRRQARWRREDSNQLHQPWRERSTSGAESSKCWMIHSVMLSFVCVAGDSVMIHFPRKRWLSISTTHAIWAWDRAEKFGSLKDFEVCSICMNEPWDKWIRSINSIDTVICPKWEINVETSSDRIIKVSV